MRIKSALLCSTLAAHLFIASPVAKAGDKLVELLPDRMIGALHIPRPQRALSPTLLKPVLDALSPNAKTTRLWLDSVKRMPGPVVIAMIAPSVGADLSRSDLVVAVELKKPDTKFEEFVEKTLAPAVVAAAGEGASGLRFEKGAAATRVFVKGRDEPVFVYAVRDRMALGSTNGRLVLRWRRGEWPKRRWVDMPGVKKMLGGLEKTPSARLLFNPVPLVRAIEKPKPNTGEALALMLLAPEEVRAAAADLTWDRSTVSLDLTVALAPDCKGIAALLARPASAPKSWGVFPENYLALGRVGLSSAAGLVRGAYALTDRFDESISAEYREELAEFTKETGVNFETDVLGRISGEIAFGVRVDFARKTPIGWAVVCPLADSSAFAEAINKLVNHFGLTFDSSDERGLPVRTAVGTVPFAMTIASGHWIIAADADTVADIAEQAAKRRDAAPLGENLRRFQTSLGEANHACLMVDIQRLRKSVPILPMAVGPKFAPLLADGAVGLAITGDEQSARLRVRWDMGRRTKDKSNKDNKDEGEYTSADGIVTLVTAVFQSVARARRLAKRVIASERLRGVAQALYVYANEHKDAFPESLEELVRVMQPKGNIDFGMLTSPYDGAGPASIDEVESKSFIIYRPGLTTRDSPIEIILAERQADEDGAIFAFQDGHTEFIPEPRASEIIELIEQGAEEIRK